MEHVAFLIPLFASTAALYASVGFGGGSTYTALLVLFQVPLLLIPKISLVCNLLVVTGGLYQYIRAKQLSLSFVLPFVVTSIPCAYMGGRLPIAKETFLILLGISLCAAGLRMLCATSLVTRGTQTTPRKSWVIGLPMGALLGLLSGMVGLGGGIFLAPLLYFLGWGTPRQIAASSSFFIFVNSLAGLWGQMEKDTAVVAWPVLLPLGIAVLCGGQIGSRLSVGALSAKHLQRITAMVILFVAFRIFWERWS